LSKAFRTAYQTEVNKIKSTYSASLQAVVLNKNYSQATTDLANKSLGRFGDSGLVIQSRGRAAVTAITQLNIALNQMVKSLTLNKTAITDQIASLKELKAKEEILAKANPDTRVSIEAGKQAKALGVKINNLNKAMSVLDGSIAKTTTKTDNQVNKVRLQSSLVPYSHSQFYDQRRREIGARLVGGQYVTDSSNVQNFNGNAQGILGQVLNRTNSQFKGFNSMTESVLALQGVVDGLGTSIKDAMMQFVTGSSSASAAIKGLLRNVLSSLAQAATQVLSNQLMKYLLSAITPFASGLTSTLAPASPMDISAALSGGKFNGGEIKGYATGGLVTSGISGRDSVLTKLAKGEFVVRSEAVKAVGLSTMHQLNSLNQSSVKSAKTVSGAGRPSIAVVPKTETNVYLLDKTSAPPSLNPSDVVAIINDDIVRSGRTKTLIKQVVTGGV